MSFVAKLGIFVELLIVKFRVKYAYFATWLLFR